MLVPGAESVNATVGAIENHEYRASTVRLQPGDALVLYTDGVVEARSAGGRHSRRAGFVLK